MTKLEDQVTDEVLTKFNALPAKSKPRNNATGLREWVPLSGIVFTNGKLLPKPGHFRGSNV